MYCLFCRKHNTKNEQNKSKVFRSDPAVRYRRPTITSHADSRQHLAAIEAAHLQKVFDIPQGVSKQRKSC